MHNKLNLIKKIFQFKYYFVYEQLSKETEERGPLPFLTVAIWNGHDDDDDHDS